MRYDIKVPENYSETEKRLFEYGVEDGYNNAEMHREADCPDTKGRYTNPKVYKSGYDAGYKWKQDYDRGYNDGYKCGFNRFEGFIPYEESDAYAIGYREGFGIGLCIE